MEIAMFLVGRLLAISTFDVRNTIRVGSRATRSALRLLAPLAMGVFALIGASAGSSQTLQPLPFTFEQNRGQAMPEYEFLFRHSGVNAGFRSNRVDLFLPGAAGSQASLRLQLIGGQSSPVGAELQEGRSNYLRGNDPSRWLRDVPNYKRIRYPNLYPGISLVFYGSGDRLEHDFLVDAGADPSTIAFRIDGAEKIERTAGGDLQIHLAGSTTTLRKPVAYQAGHGSRTNVDADFLLSADGVVRFRIGPYEATSPLVIDPVFVFSTFLDGSGADAIAAVTTDAAG
jgi:hypothetical protein